MKIASIITPKGFKTASINCGIKNRKKDLALIYSEIPAVCAGTFTTNRVKAASVKLSQKVVGRGKMQAIIVNSGNANCLTGKEGEINAKKMADITAEELGISPSLIAVASTGPIAKQLPIDVVTKGIKIISCLIDNKSFPLTAQAIMTTDTYQKCLTRQFKIDGKTVTLTGIAKGAGMIQPNMATMFCFITTDLNIAHPALSKITKEAVRYSFNCITVDACMSTNDSVIVMANGLANNAKVKEGTKEYKVVMSEFFKLTKELAKLIAADGEGATKLIQIDVVKAKSFDSARQIGLSIANYDLLKCSFYGEIINIGRIMAAIGASSVNTNPEKINIYIQNKLFLKKGTMAIKITPETHKILKAKNIFIKVELNQGEENATIWTCDLSPEYVKINMD